MIKGVLFDFGGVLTEGGKVGAVRQIFSDAYGVPPEALKGEDIGLQALKGVVSDDAFLEAMNKKFPDGRPVTREHFLETVDFLGRCAPVYELATTLRAHGIKTGILSNMFTMAAEVLQKQGLYDDFEPLLLSCEVHMAKPDPAFYELALHRFDLQPQEVLFIDDQSVFLEPAKQFGMHTLLATSPEQIVRDTKALLIKENGLEL